MTAATHQAGNVAEAEGAPGSIDQRIEGVRVRRQLPRLHGLQHQSYTLTVSMQSARKQSAEVMS
jgi:hypothetical protein